MQFGIQGYGLLQNTDMELRDILQELHKAGYRIFEPCISFKNIPGYERVIWNVHDYPQYASLLKSEGFQVVSCHIFPKDLFADGKEIVSLAERYGIRQFVLKSPRDISEQSLQQAAQNYLRLADQLEPCGAKVLLHNEVNDSEKRIQGKTAFEFLLDLCLGKVYAQVDVGWAMRGGEDPVAMFQRNRERVNSLHLKDISGDHEVPLGNGDLNLAGCCQFAKSMGIPLVVDQDSFTESPLKQVCDAAALLQSIACHETI